MKIKLYIKYSDALCNAFFRFHTDKMKNEDTSDAHSQLNSFSNVTFNKNISSEYYVDGQTCISREGCIQLSKGGIITGTLSGDNVPLLTSSTDEWTIMFWMKPDKGMLEETAFGSTKLKDLENNLIYKMGTDADTKAVFKALLDACTNQDWIHVTFVFHPVKETGASTHYVYFTNKGYSAYSARDSQGTTPGQCPWILPLTISGNNLTIGGYTGSGTTGCSGALTNVGEVKVPFYGYIDDIVIDHRIIPTEEISLMNHLRDYDVIDIQVPHFKIYRGIPPENVRQWAIKNYGPDSDYAIYKKIMSGEITLLDNIISNTTMKIDTLTIKE